MFNRSKDAAMRINLEPKAWNIKYFIAASASWNQLDPEISGKNEIILISRAIHIISQWEEEIIIRVLRNKDDENKAINGNEDIKKEGT